MRPTEPGLYWYWDHEYVRGPELVMVRDGDPPIFQKKVYEHGSGQIHWLHELTYPGVFLGPLEPPARPQE